MFLIIQPREITAATCLRRSLRLVILYPLSSRKQLVCAGRPAAPKARETPRPASVCRSIFLRFFMQIVKIIYYLFLNGFFYKRSTVTPRISEKLGIGRVFCLQQILAVVEGESPQLQMTFWLEGSSRGAGTTLRSQPPWANLLATSLRDDPQPLEREA